jgi:hypothetical protein
MVYSLEWSKKASCAGIPTEMFFEEYENDESSAKDVDLLCDTCPIQRECLSIGVGRRETGVWGGVYLQNGQISTEFNEHKTNEDWGRLWLNLTTRMK